MSETDKPQPDPQQPVQPQQPPPQEPSGAEAPTQPDQPAPETPPQEQTVQAPPAQPVPVAAKRPARTVTMRTWLVAGIGALILVVAGLGGYFIGAANDHDRDRPGATRFDHRAPGPRDNGPRFREGPFRDRGPTPG